MGTRVSAYSMMKEIEKPGLSMRRLRKCISSREKALTGSAGIALANEVPLTVSYASKLRMKSTFISRFFEADARGAVVKHDDVGGFEELIAQKIAQQQVLGGIAFTDPDVVIDIAMQQILTDGTRAVFMGKVADPRRILLFVICQFHNGFSGFKIYPKHKQNLQNLPNRASC